MNLSLLIKNNDLSFAPLKTTFVRFYSAQNLQNKKLRDKFYRIKADRLILDKFEYKEGDNLPKYNIPRKNIEYPNYDYVNRIYKKQNTALLGGLFPTKHWTVTKFGKKHKHFRLPNIQRVKLWSETLNKTIELDVEANVLDIITMEGGLDNYLTKTCKIRVMTLGLLGWKLRYEVLKQKEFNELPVVETSSGVKHKVLYIHKDKKRFIVGKDKLLDELFESERINSYTPISREKFDKYYGFAPIDVIVDKLIENNHDFSKIVV